MEAVFYTSLRGQASALVSHWYRIGIALPGPHRLHAVSASAFPLSQQRAALSEIAGRSDP